MYKNLENLLEILARIFLKYKLPFNTCFRLTCTTGHALNRLILF